MRGQTHERTLSFRTAIGAMLSIALVASACDDDFKSISNPPMAPSSPPVVIVDIEPPDQAPFVSTLSFSPAPQPPAFDLVVVASTPMFLDEATIDLIGPAFGSFLFPRPVLARDFGSTLIPGGARRTFAFGRNHRRGSGQPRAMSVSLTFVTMDGTPHHVRADGIGF
jgi:hypothetical protein